MELEWECCVFCKLYYTCKDCLSKDMGREKCERFEQGKSDEVDV